LVFAEVVTAWADGQVDEANEADPDRPAEIRKAFDEWGRGLRLGHGSLDMEPAN
jgi:hypothetical protein